MLADSGMMRLSCFQTRAFHSGVRTGGVAGSILMPELAGFLPVVGETLAERRGFVVFVAP